MRRLTWCVLCLCSILPAPAEEAHPWRPPFGLDRVGHSAQVSGVEADAQAHPGEILNPVDLGAILVPHGWLLLGPGQNTIAEVAVLSHLEPIDPALVRA